MMTKGGLNLTQHVYKQSKCVLLQVITNLTLFLRLIISIKRMLKNNISVCIEQHCIYILFFINTMESV